MEGETVGAVLVQVFLVVAGEVLGHGVELLEQGEGHVVGLHLVPLQGQGGGDTLQPQVVEGLGGLAEV